MKYRCLVFDHDDTVVNSTATIHHPCFMKYLSLKYPGRSCTLEEYFIKNFSPGFLSMCINEYGMNSADIEDETVFWNSYVASHIPDAYQGMREIMERHVSEGGIICVASHSMSKNILRDYKANRLPQPELIYGWDLPLEMRKPAPFSLQDIMERLSLKPEELLMIDDLKPGYDMARACGVDFAAAGWANDIPEIESFMRLNSDFYFKTVNELKAFLFA